MAGKQTWRDQVRELRHVCWDPRRQYDGFQHDPMNWEALYISRPLSIWITFFIKDWPVTPNGITLTWVLMGTAGAALLAVPEWVWLGVALLYLARLLDNVDGEVARYRGQFSQAGNLLDMIGHQTVPTALFAALGLSTALAKAPVTELIAAMTAAVTVIPFTKIRENALLLLALKALSTPQSNITDGPPPSPVPRNNPLRTVVILVFSEIGILYLLVPALALGATDIYLYLYGIGLPLLLVPKYRMRARELERHCQEPQSLQYYIRQEWLD